MKPSRFSSSLHRVRSFLRRKTGSVAHRSAEKSRLLLFCTFAVVAGSRCVRACPRIHEKSGMGRARAARPL